MGELKQDYYSTDIRRTVERPWRHRYNGDDKETGEAARSSQKWNAKVLSGSDKEGQD